MAWIIDYREQMSNNQGTKYSMIDSSLIRLKPQMSLKYQKIKKKYCSYGKSYVEQAS